MCVRRVMRLCGVRAAAAVVCRRVEREGEGELRLVCVHRQLRLRARLIPHEESIMHTHLLRGEGGARGEAACLWLGPRGHGRVSGSGGAWRGAACTAAAASPNCAASIGAIRSRIATRNLVRVRVGVRVRVRVRVRVGVGVRVRVRVLASRRGTRRAVRARRAPAGLWWAPG